MGARPAALPQRSVAAALIVAAQEGSPAARGQLLDLYWRYLVALAGAQIDGQLRPKVAPSDAAQETLLRADQNFGKFTGGSVREWEAWLHTLALNTIADLRRRFRSRKRNIVRERSLDGVGSRPFLEGLSTLGLRPAADSVADREAAEHIFAAVRALRPSHQAIIVWSFRDGLGVAEIAVKLGRSEDATRMLLKRAVAALKKQLGNADEHR